MKPVASLRNLVRAPLFLAWVLPFLVSCERKPTAAEIDEARRAQDVAAATPKPTPKAGEWMYDKKRKSPLDEPARK